MGNTRWSTEEDAIIINNWETMGQKTVSLLSHRTPQSIKRRAHQLGLKVLSRKPVEPGTRFGRLVVIEIDIEATNRRNRVYRCQCDCGTTTSVFGQNLKRGTSISCGCFRSESMRNIDPTHVSWITKYSSYINGAEQRGVDFTLTMDEFKEIASKPCVYCGVLPAPYNPYLTKTGEPRRKKFKNSPEVIDRSWINLNGVDRVFNHIGYVVGNCVSCCSVCNVAKSSMAPSEWNTYLHRLVSYQLKLRQKS